MRRHPELMGAEQPVWRGTWSVKTCVFGTALSAMSLAMGRI